MSCSGRTPRAGPDAFTRLRRAEAAGVSLENDPARRWVIYAGDNDGSRVPPDWQLWLRGTIDDLPSEALPPVRRFQKKPTPNLTGTMAAFRPDGALGSGKIRPASTGDYEPWIPE